MWSYSSDVIAMVFRSRTELKLKNQEKNFEFNASSEGKLVKFCHKSEMEKMSNESSRGIEDCLDSR